MKEFEAEAEKLRVAQEQQNEKLKMSSPGGTDTSEEERKQSDDRSICIKCVDYAATPVELEAHFKGCGKINRVFIKTDKYTGRSQGYAYLEFADKDSVETALALDGSLFRGRQIVVSV